MKPVEVKTKRGKLTMAQRRYPGPRTVVRSVDDMLAQWAKTDRELADLAVAGRIPKAAVESLLPYLHHQPTCAADSFDTGMCHCGLRKALQAAGLLPIPRP